MNTSASFRGLGLTATVRNQHQRLLHCSPYSLSQNIIRRTGHSIKPVKAKYRDLPGQQGKARRQFLFQCQVRPGTLIAEAEEQSRQSKSDELAFAHRSLGLEMSQVCRLGSVRAGHVSAMC